MEAEIQILESSIMSNVKKFCYYRTIYPVRKKQAISSPMDILRFGMLVMNHDKSRNYIPETLVGCKFIIEQGVEANATSLVARAWPRTHW